MALPIAPTPVLTGKNAIAMERYMRESKVKKDRLFERKVNIAEIDRLIAERKKVHDESGIPVFDLDMVESLIDWRM